MLGLERKESAKLWTSVRNVCRVGTLCGMLAAMPFMIGGCPDVPDPRCDDDGAADCSDGDFCNGTETCNADTGNCDDGTAPCDADTQICLEETDACVGTCDVDEDCVDDDADDCTSSACNTETGTCISVNNTADCDDGDVCTDGDVCADGACAGAAVDGCCETDADCVGGDVCVENQCAAPDPCDGVVCDEGFVCVDGTCEAGLCLDNTCDDSDACNGVETCDDATGDCVDGDAVVCEDGFVCDSATGDCLEQTACDVDADCDDGVFCNGAETCTDSFCADGAAPCTDAETCDEDLLDCLIGGETFNFTTDIDDLSGTGGDDVFRGVSATTNGTLSAGDSANGGAGNDQLQIFLTTADLGPGISMDNIQRVFAQNTSSTARSLSTLGWTGLTELWTDNSLGAVTFTGMTALMQVGVLSTDQDVTATFNNTALVGTNSVPVELDGAQNGVDIVIGSTGSDGVETITVDSAGTVANRIDGIDDGGENDFTALTLTGDQDLRIDGPIGTSVKTVDASAMTGAADVSVGGLTAFTFTGTDQDDTIRATNIGSTDTIDGGAGTGDSLIVSGTFGTTTITGVEALTLQPTSSTPSFDLTNAQDITAVTVEPTLIITGLSASGLPPSTAITVNSDFGMELGNTASAYTLETAGGSNDSLAFVFTGNGDVDISGGADITAAGFESVSMTFNNNGTLTFNAGNVFTDAGNTLKKVTLAANGALDSSPAGLLASNAAFNELDATGVAGKLTVDAGNFPGSTMKIDSGAGNDTIATGAGNTTVNSGAGNDGITGGAGDDIIDGGAGNDTITGGAGVDTLTGGADDDTFAYTAATDSMTDVTSDTTINATTEVVADFGTGTNKIDVSGFSANGTAAVFAQATTQAVLDALNAGAGPTTLEAAADAALGQGGMAGNVNSQVTAFQFGGNTYVVATNSAAGALANADLMLELTGAHTLSGSNLIP